MIMKNGYHNTFRFSTEPQDLSPHRENGCLKHSFATKVHEGTSRITTNTNSVPSVRNLSCTQF